MFKAIIIVAVLTVAVSGSPTKSAPEGFIYIGSYAGSSDEIGVQGLTDYYISTEIADFYTAFTRCSSSALMGNLLNIGSAAELNSVRSAVLANVAPPAQLWTSGIHNGVRWIWGAGSREGQPIDGSFWGPGAPGAINQGVYLQVAGPLTSQRYLMTTGISTRLRYICQVGQRAD